MTKQEIAHEIEDLKWFRKRYIRLGQNENPYLQWIFWIYGERRSQDNFMLTILKW